LLHVRCFNTGALRTSNQYTTPLRQSTTGLLTNTFWGHSLICANHTGWLHKSRTQ